MLDGARHPVVERLLPRGEFVPNGVHLDAATRQVLLLTGPNMGGKSTYLRQVALIVLLAQAGSWVPAERATIGLVDRLFTRVGAADRLGAGQSTFMVEMSETADILRGATRALARAARRDRPRHRDLRRPGAGVGGHRAPARAPRARARARSSRRTTTS